MPFAKSGATPATSIPVTVYNLVQGKLRESPIPQECPKRKKVLPLPAVAIPRKDSNLKLQSLPQPHRTGKTPHGLIPCQLP